MTTIALADVTEVRKAKSGLKRNLLEVVRADGSSVMFAVQYDQWKPDVVAALQGAGRQVRDDDEVVTVT